MAIDTLKVARRLREAGFSEPQAEAVVAAVQEGEEGGDFATKGDLTIQNVELKAEIAAQGAELRAEIAAVRAEIELVRSEMREMEQRLISRMTSEIASLRSDLSDQIASLKSELGWRMFQMILSAVLVNFVAMLGVMFAFAKMLGH
jgi:hypothetical protein